MTAAGVVRAVREVFLTSAALLGVVCVLLTVTGAVADVRPLVVRSGSMSPAIETGDLSISRTVSATALERGDIVSVLTSTGTRVTHRIVDISGTGGQRELRLRGDANTVVDQEVYPVTTAEKVQFTVPRMGYVVSAATTPAGLFVLGMYVAGLLAVVFSRPGGGPPRGGSRKTPSDDAEPDDRPHRSGAGRVLARSVLVPMFSVALLAATPAVAAPWVDSVAISGPNFSTHTLLPPDSATCDHDKKDKSVEIEWPEKDSRYNYEVTLRSESGALVSTRQVTGADVAITFDRDSDFGYGLGLNLAKDEQFDVAIRSYLATAPTWRSAGTTAPNKRVQVKSTQHSHLVQIDDVKCK